MNYIIRLIIHYQFNLLMTEAVQMKLVIVGDGSVGKTCVMIRFTEKYFNAEYVPTVFDNRTHSLAIDGIKVNLGLWDTAGQEQYSRLRPIAYPFTDIFLIAFSVVSPDSFINAKKKWYPQIRKEVPNARVMFVGNKTDLRNSFQFDSNPKNRPLTAEELEKDIGSEFGSIYMECSALTNVGVTQVFEQAARIVMWDRGLIKQNAQNSKNKSSERLRQKELRQNDRCYCNLI